MINTITLNPSLDYILNVESFSINNLNRTINEAIYCGGKGINVSIVLKNLGIENRALGYIAGFTGDEILRQLSGHGVVCDFVKVKDGFSRINVKLKSNGETEINGLGPHINEEDLKVLYTKISNLNNEDYLVLSGSIPKNLPNNVYENIIKLIKDKEIKFIVDTTKEALLNVLKYEPFLIKPNHHELEEIFNVKLNNIDEIIKYGVQLQKMGARNVVVSMAGDGAVLIPESGVPIKKNSPKGVLKNSVGAGDSMIAGFLYGYIKTNSVNEAFKMGIATGSASAFSEKLATKEEAERLLKQI